MEQVRLQAEFDGVADQVIHRSRSGLLVPICVADGTVAGKGGGVELDGVA